jgi:hypothetical protein
MLISTYFAIKYTIKIALEVPTGGLADRFGDKNCLFFALVAKILCVVFFMWKIDV